MNIQDIIVGDRILIQSGRASKEVAKVVAIDDERIIIKNSFGDIEDIEPKFVIKTFGQR